ELHVDLVELAETAFLGALVAEHRSAREEFERQALRETVRDDGAADAGGILGPKRDLVTAPVAEGVHLPHHHVGGLADRAREDLGELEDRRGNLLVAVALRDPPRSLDHAAMAALLGRQEILGAADRLQSGHQRGSSRRRYCAARDGVSAGACSASIFRTFSSTSCTKCSTMSASLRRWSGTPAMYTWCVPLP